VNNVKDRASTPNTIAAGSSATFTYTSSVTVTCPAAQDTYVDMFDPGNAHDEDGSFALWLDNYDSYGEHAEVLLQFDLSAVPAGATVQSAVIRLYEWRSVGVSGTGDTVEVVKCDAGWDEATATWNSDGTNGTEVVGTYVLPPLSDGLQDPPVLFEMSGPEIVSLVQGWVDAPGTNYGVRLHPAGDPVDVRFVDMEDTRGVGGQYVPVLEVTYTMGGGDEEPPVVGVEAVEVSGSVQDASPVRLTAGGVPVTVGGTGGFTVEAGVSSLPVTVSLVAEDAGGESTRVEVTFR